jgi:hypothetical protein
MEFLGRTAREVAVAAVEIMAVGEATAGREDQES